MCVVNNPIPAHVSTSTLRLAKLGEKGEVLGDDVLLDVPSQEREVEDQRQPIPVDEKQEGQETVYGSLGDDVGVQAVAEVDGVDVVATIGVWSAKERRGRLGAGSSWRIPFQIAVHNGEEDLQEQVDGVYQHRKKE